MWILAITGVELIRTYSTLCIRLLVCILDTDQHSKVRGNFYFMFDHKLNNG